MDNRTIDLLFDFACNLSATDQIAFVESLATEHRDELQEMLRANDSVERDRLFPPLNTSLIVTEPEPPTQFDAKLPGSRRADDLIEVPGYEVHALIGYGGMGRVYEATQLDFRRRVALKVINSKSPDQHAIRRFEREKLILARMDHPGIAKVYDAGTTSTGLPYLAMELIQGEAIAKYCDEKNLPVIDRLLLFIELCRAIDYAHRNGVIHRDLKPTNVLVNDVNGRPAPKTIDFGLASLLDEASPGKGDGSPMYMSPEQDAGAAVITQSDQFSLGVVLFELLTGSVPLAIAQLRQPTVDRRVLLKNAHFPSLTDAVAEGTLDPKVVAAKRATTPKRLNELLNGDLSLIVAKTLGKKSSDRYSGLPALIDDLERLLANKPVSVSEKSYAYRLRKWYARNRQISRVLFVACLGLLFAAGIILDAWISQGAAREASYRMESQLRQVEFERREATEEALRERTMHSALFAGRRGQWSQMHESLQAYSQLDPGNHEAHVLMIGALDALGKMSQRDELIASLLQVRELPNPLKGHVLLWKGDVLDAKGLYSEADEFIDRARSAGLSKSDQAYANAIQASSTREAANAFAESIRLQLADGKTPYHYRAQAGLAVEYFLLGERDECRRICHEMIFAVPEDPRFMFLLGLSDCVEGRPERAANRLESARHHLTQETCERARRVYRLLDAATNGDSATSALAAFKAILELFGARDNEDIAARGFRLSRRLRRLLDIGVKITKANGVEKGMNLVGAKSLAGFFSDPVETRLQAARELVAVNPEGSARAYLAFAQLQSDLANNNRTPDARSVVATLATEALQSRFLIPSVRWTAFDVAGLCTFLNSGPDGQSLPEELEAFVDAEFREQPFIAIVILAVYRTESGEFEEADVLFTELLRRDPTFDIWGQGEAAHWAAHVACELGEYLKALKLIEKCQGKAPPVRYRIPALNSIEARARDGLAKAVESYSLQTNQ